MIADEGLKSLMPLDKCASQPYFSNRIQLADLIEWVVGQIGRADIRISTFSTSEEFLRRLYRMKCRDLIGSCTLVCDFRAARKTLALHAFIKSVFDAVFLCGNHSKVVLLSSATCKVSIVTSQNQTRGDRYEAGIVSNAPATFSRLSETFRTMTENSYSIDELLTNNN